MKIPDYNRTLLETIKQKIPNKTNPADFLADILYIGKEAAYRRLRGEVGLSLDEAILIAQKLEISLDRIVKADTEKVSVYRMCMAEFDNSTETDYKILEEYVDLVRLAANDPSSKLSISANMFPQQIYLQYENLSRFFLFLRAYHDRGLQAKAYHEIFVSERMRRIFRDSFEVHQQFNSIIFVLDKHVLLYLIQNIRYFHNTGLIRKEEVELIYQDILQMLAYIEKIAVTGQYENGKQVSLYISNINFDKNYCNIKMLDYYISIIETYILNGAASTDKTNYDRTEEWILSMCRLSTMISSCGELYRISFFDEQRRLLDTLLNDNE